MKKHNVIIVHGAYGHAQENWFAWLKEKLQQLNIECYVPELPTPINQHLDIWLEIFTKTHKNNIHQNTILIGHSLGSAFILQWLQQQHTKVAAVILSGVFLGEIGNKKFDSINSSFFAKDLTWNELANLAKRYICYHGENDTYVPLDMFYSIAEKLTAEKNIISQGGHLNAAAGYTKFSLLLNRIKRLVAEAENE